MIFEYVKPKNWWGFTKLRTVKHLMIFGIGISAGYETDGATVSRYYTAIGMGVLLFLPLSLWCYFGIIICLIPVIFPRYSNYMEAALLHDFRVANKKTGRLKYDKEFYGNLLKCGVHKWRAVPMYLAVSAYSILVAPVYITIKELFKRKTP